MGRPSGDVPARTVAAGQRSGCAAWSSPQKWAGRQTLAPESVPSPHGEPCAATIAASPPLLPPGVRVRS
jgi:hypothetical protein